MSKEIRFYEKLMMPRPAVHMADMKKACAIDTNRTQNGGQQSCTESPEESEKASMQVSALLCNLLQTSQVPPLGLEVFGSYPLFNRPSPVLVKQLGAQSTSFSFIRKPDPIGFNPFVP